MPAPFRHMKFPARSWTVSSLMVVIGAAALAGQSAPPGALRGDAPSPIAPCGTEARWELNGRMRPYALANGLPDGEPYMFDQDPPLLLAGSSNTLTLRNFAVVGDFASVTFLRATREAPDGASENWERASKRTIDGQIVSVFEPTWTAREIDEAYGYHRYGVDQPFMYWGSFQVPGGSTERYVYVRTGLAGIPGSQVNRINDQVQYASDVVNLVVPTFEDARVAGGMNGFDLVSASRLFYQYFSDAYDVLAFTPQSTAIGDFGAFHRNVQNSVSGLNIDLFNDAARYGSAGALQGIEVYTSSTAALYEDIDHEMAHQWGSRFDWTRIASISRAGHQPAAHSPLWTGGETLIGAVLYGDRRVASSNGTYTIEQTPPPAVYHPLEQYSMGALRADEVPDFEVFVNQDQFDAASAASPEVGTALQGGVKTVGIADVIRIHGPRIGPSPRTWRRATVLISRDRLASQQEMDYWNFFAQRLADRNGAGKPTYEHYVSFARATNRAIALQTTIAPLAQPALDQRLDTDTPVFGPSDFRGVRLTSALSSRFATNQSVSISGRVTASDRSDFEQISFNFWKVDAAAPVRFNGTVSRSGDFTVPVRFDDSQRGAYYAAVYLFWPGSGSQYPRSSVSTFTVE